MSKAGSIARGGIYTALSVLLLYGSSILPTSKLTIFTVVSAIIPLSIVTLDVRSSFLVYASTSILSLLLGLRGAAITYMFFFGIYGFVKYFAEGLRKTMLEIILKLAFFNISLTLIYLLYRTFFMDISSIKLPIPLLILFAQAAFILYDYALTLIISYINKRFV